MRRIPERVIKEKEPGSNFSPGIQELKEEPFRLEPKSQNENQKGCRGRKSLKEKRRKKKKGGITRRPNNHHHWER